MMLGASGISVPRRWLTVKASSQEEEEEEEEEKVLAF